MLERSDLPLLLGQGRAELLGELFELRGVRCKLRCVRFKLNFFLSQLRFVLFKLNAFLSQLRSVLFELRCESFVLSLEFQHVHASGYTVLREKCNRFFY